MKEVYLLAMERGEPLAPEELRAAFESEEVALQVAEDGRQFTLQAEDSRVQVHFEPRALPEGWQAGLFSGSEQALALLGRAQAFYRLAINPGPPQPTLAIFEALWCARLLLEAAGGVLVDLSSFRVHGAEDVAEMTELDFDIRDHVSLHAVEVIEGDTPLWVHSHGMEKFGARDLEIFHLAEQDLRAAETFLYELCTDLAFSQGPPERREVGTSEGQTFMLVPSEEARVNLLGVPLETFEGHEALFLTVVSPEGRHNTSELLRHYRERFAQEPLERTEALRQQAQGLLPAFKSRFLRRGFMEPFTFLVRAPFETHPEGEPVVENLWLEVLAWEEGSLVGRLTDGAVHTTEWRKGAQIELPESEVNALALQREGRTLDDEEILALLQGELPV